MDILENYGILSLKESLEAKVKSCEESLEFLKTVNHSLSHAAIVSKPSV